MHGSTIKASNNFEKNAKKLHGDVYNYSKVNYTSSTSKVTITCKYHGDFTITPKQHLGDKSGCPKCNNYNKQGTSTDFSNYIWKETLGEYYLIGEYLNALTKVKVLHTLCGNTWEVTPNKFKLGRRCPVCKNKRVHESTKKLEPMYKRELFLKHNGDISLIGTYINGNTSIKHKHICGYIWKAMPNNLLNGTSCPKCQKGSDNDILYVWQIPLTDIYKIGITSERLGVHRLLKVYENFNIDSPLSIVKFSTVANAAYLEALLLRTYKNKPKWSYSLDGHSEFRTLTEKELNEMLRTIKLYEKESA